MSKLNRTNTKKLGVNYEYSTECGAFLLKNERESSEITEYTSTSIFEHIIYIFAHTKEEKTPTLEKCIEFIVVAPQSFGLFHSLLNAICHVAVYAMKASAALEAK